MRALHFTDIHLTVPWGELSPRDWLSKRLLGALNHWARRRRYFRDAPRKVVRLAEFVEEHGVELVLSTGDHTLLGTEAEYRLARSALAPLLAKGSGFVHVPGNHDLYLGDSVRERRFERYFGDSLDSDRPQYRVDGHWPLVRLFGDTVAVVAVNSARPNPAPWRSSGKIPDCQLAALGKVFADPEVNQRFVFVLTHYGPLGADGAPDRPSHGLVNGTDFLRVCAHLPRGAILHGHIHHAFCLRAPGVRPPIYNAGSTTCAGREAFWLFDIDEREARVRRGRWDGERYRLEPNEVRVD